MADCYDNTNTGILYKNDNRKSEKSPQYGGSINIEGVEYWLNGWVKTGKSGKLKDRQFFSLTVKPKDPENTDHNQTAPPRKQQQQQDEDIPF